MQVNLVLVMFQTNSELCFTKPTALPISLETLTTVSVDVMGSGIVEFLQTDFKDALRTVAGKAELGDGRQNDYRCCKILHLAHSGGNISPSKLSNNCKNK